MESKHFPIDFVLDYYKTLCSNNILWPIEVYIVEDFYSRSIKFITKVEYNNSKFKSYFTVGMLYFNISIAALKKEINKGFEEVKEEFKLFRNKVDKELENNNGKY